MTIPWWGILIAVAVMVILQLVWYRHGFWRGFCRGRICKVHPMFLTCPECGLPAETPGIERPASFYNRKKA